MKEINNALLKEFRAAYDRDAASRTLNSALAKTDLRTCLLCPCRRLSTRDPLRWK